MADEKKDKGTTGQGVLQLMTKAERIQARFEKFHKDNPHVYAELARLAREWRASNPKRSLGIKALWERLRWELNVRPKKETDPPDDFALNNSWTSRYARLLMKQEADLVGLFETRVLTSELTRR